jgi:glycosyltransferase involved in cell wall biosynthesis
LPRYRDCLINVAVLIPVLRRPERVASLISSLRASEGGVHLHPLFVCSGGDSEEIAAIDAEDVPRLVARWEPGPGDYARKMNYGYCWAVEQDYEWVFLAADDVIFHQGWADAAVSASGGACVVGTNDLGNPEVMAGRHATHSMVHRDYLDCGTVDEEGKILHEGYCHNWVDNEFVGTAKARGTFVSARDSKVEHLHWAWGKGDHDEIYAKGAESYHADRKLFEERRKLWE